MSRLSRRSFLAGSAASFAAGPAFGQRARTAPARAPDEVDCIIVGAGAAGIAAARRLSAAGRSFTLVEASNRIGGRCFAETQSFGVAVRPRRAFHPQSGQQSADQARGADRARDLSGAVRPAHPHRPAQRPRRRARGLSGRVGARQSRDRGRGARQGRRRLRQRAAPRPRRLAVHRGVRARPLHQRARTSARFRRRISAAPATATSPRSAARATARCSPSSPRAFRCSSTPR